MAVQYVKIIQRTAWLNTDFGIQLACQKLQKTPEEIEALVGRNKKGKRVGQLKGQLIWYSVIEAGWVKMGRYDHDAMQGNGFVQRMKVSYGYAIIDPWKLQDQSNSPAIIAADSDYDEDERVSLSNFNSRSRNERAG